MYASPDPLAFSIGRDSSLGREFPNCSSPDFITWISCEDCNIQPHFPLLILNIWVHAMCLNIIVTKESSLFNSSHGFGTGNSRLDNKSGTLTRAAKHIDRHPISMKEVTSAGPRLCSFWKEAGKTMKLMSPQPMNHRSCHS